MITLTEGVLGIKINGKLHLVLAKRATVMDWNAGKRTNLYTLTEGALGDVGYTYTVGKEFN